jgi:hypothetical protein
MGGNLISFQSREEWKIKERSKIKLHITYFPLNEAYLPFKGCNEFSFGHTYGQRLVRIPHETNGQKVGELLKGHVVGKSCTHGTHFLFPYDGLISHL